MGDFEMFVELLLKRLLIGFAIRPMTGIVCFE